MRGLPTDRYPLSDRQIVLLEDVLNRAGLHPSDWMYTLSAMRGRRITHLKQIRQGELDGLLESLRSVPEQRRRAAERLAEATVLVEGPDGTFTPARVVQP